MTTRPTRPDAVWSIDDLELELRKLPGVRAAGFEEDDDILLVQLHVADYAERINRSDRTDQPVPIAASRIAARHSDRPVTVEVVRWRNAPVIATPVPPAPAEGVEVTAPQPAEIDGDTDTDTGLESATDTGRESANETEVVLEVVAAPSRARLLAVLAFPETDELEVHLVLDSRRTIGRAPASQGIEGAVLATIDAVRELGAEMQPSIRWVHALDDADEDDEIVVAVALDDVDPRSLAQYGLAAGSSLIDAAARATLDALNRTITRDA